MVKFYVVQIRLGRINMDDVPEKWREAVVAELDAINYGSL